MNVSKCQGNQNNALGNGENAESSVLMRLAFYFIFPGFFIYHILIAEEYIRPILGGYSTGIAVLLLPLLCFAYVKNALHKTQHFSLIEAGFLGYTAYFGFVICFNVAVGADISIAGPLLAIIPQFIAIFIVSKLVNPVNPSFKRGAIVFYIVLTGIIFLKTADGVFTVSKLDAPSNIDHLADYQGYAFVYTVVALFALTNLRLRWMRVIIYGTAIPALFFTGARTEFMGFLVVVLLIEFCIAKHKLLICAAGVALLVGSLGILGLIGDRLPDNRVLALTANYTVDESVVARINLLYKAWDTLGNHPILGSFASYEPGEYAHNALSAWVDLGLFGFMAYLALLVYPMIDLLRHFSRRSQDPEYILTLSIVTLVVLFAVTAKNFTYQMFPIAVGLYTRFIILNRTKRTVWLGRAELPDVPMVKLMGQQLK